MAVLRIAFVASVCTCCAVADLPVFYCAYNCSAVKKPSPPGHCTPEYCQHQSAEGCLLIPKMPPTFQTAATCDAFAAQKPNCHAGGSCYVDGGLPEMPAEWRHGFAMSLRMNQTMWQYGTEKQEHGLISRMAVDPDGEQMLSESQGSDGEMGQFYSASLLLGTQKRLYSFVNMSGPRPAKYCMYVELNASSVKLLLDLGSLKNYTFYRDAEINGDNVRIFRYAPPLVGSPLIDVEGDSLHATRGGPTPAGSVVTAVSIRSVGGDLIFARPSLQPMRMESGSATPSSAWDAMGGFQGAFMSANFEEFHPGRPPAVLFKVPSDWGECKPVPTPPHVMHGVPMLGIWQPPLRVLVNKMAHSPEMLV